ncbi:MAG: ABC transporter permease [Alphaproteobacteria bacterium]|nr:ABC transporter permease [Alphaproteobacteria bacterium]
MVGGGGEKRVVGIAAWLILGFLVLPSLIIIPIGFGNSNEIIFPPNRFGIDLFVRFFTEPGWVSATLVSLRVACVTTLLSVLVGVPAAYALSRGRFPGKRLLALFLLSPIMVPGVVIAVALYIYFARIGLRNGDARLVLGHVVATLPFVIVTASAGLRQVDPALETAATIMGASRFYLFRRVTLPLIRPSIVAGALFAFLMSFDEVVISWFVARADTTTLPVKMFSSIQWEVSAVLAAISTMLTVLSAVVCLAVARIQKKEGA